MRAGGNSMAVEVRVRCAACPRTCSALAPLGPTDRGTETLGARVRTDRLELPSGWTRPPAGPGRAWVCPVCAGEDRADPRGGQQNK